MFASALRTKPKNFPTLLDDVSSKLTRCLLGHFMTMYFTRFSAQRQLVSYLTRFSCCSSWFLVAVLLLSLGSGPTALFSLRTRHRTVTSRPSPNTRSAPQKHVTTHRIRDDRHSIVFTTCLSLCSSSVRPSARKQFLRSASDVWGRDSHARIGDTQHSRVLQVQRPEDQPASTPCTDRLDGAIRLNQNVLPSNLRKNAVLCVRSSFSRDSRGCQRCNVIIHVDADYKKS